MKRFGIGLAVCLLVGSVADAAGPLGGAVPVSTPYSGDALPSVGAEGRYGLLPFLRKGFWWRPQAGGCAGCGPTAPYAAGPYAAGPYGPAIPGAGIPGVPQPGMPGMGMPGTLVFPTHPYMRSPRDFFMLDR